MKQKSSQMRFAPWPVVQAALALAMEHNPSLRAAAQAVAASEGAMIQSQARPNPELAFSQEDTRRATRSSNPRLVPPSSSTSPTTLPTQPTLAK